MNVVQRPFISPAAFKALVINGGGGMRVHFRPRIRLGVQHLRLGDQQLAFQHMGLRERRCRPNDVRFFRGNRNFTLRGRDVAERLLHCSNEICAGTTEIPFIG